ncbi:unnamed protein product [Durusdinium trenchii]|uniref:EF-hand domain-containing protein n=1 Tax=Durusdinium trenchii TaxID=1381693 RepID=A0ABP0KS34_9DINO
MELLFGSGDDDVSDAPGAAPEAAPPPAAAGDFFGAAVTPVLVEAETPLQAQLKGHLKDFQDKVTAAGAAPPRKDLESEEELLTALFRSTEAVRMREARRAPGTWLQCLEASMDAAEILAPAWPRPGRVKVSLSPKHGSGAAAGNTARGPPSSPLPEEVEGVEEVILADEAPASAASSPTQELLVDERIHEPRAVAEAAVEGVELKELVEPEPAPGLQERQETPQTPGPQAPEAQEAPEPKELKELKEPPKESQEIFARHDDGDGYLSREELDRLKADTSLELDFDRLDADGDGLISQEELANAMDWDAIGPAVDEAPPEPGQLGPLQELYRAYAGSDGLLSRLELQQMKGENARLQELDLEKFDLDGDGIVTQEEFARALDWDAVDEVHPEAAPSQRSSTSAKLMSVINVQKQSREAFERARPAASRKEKRKAKRNLQVRTSRPRCGACRWMRHEEAGRRSEGLPEALGDPSPSIPLGTPNLTGERTQAEDDEPAMSAPRRSLEVPAASPVEPELKPRLSRHEEAGRRSEGLPEALGDPSPSIPLGTPNLTGERTQAEDDEPAMSAPRRSLEVPNPSPASPVEPELKPRLSRQSGAELAEYAAAELREAGVLQSDEESGAEEHDLGSDLETF